MPLNRPQNKGIKKVVGNDRGLEVRKAISRQQIQVWAVATGTWNDNNKYDVICNCRLGIRRRSGKDRLVDLFIVCEDLFVY